MNKRTTEGARAGGTGAPARPVLRTVALLVLLGLGLALVYGPLLAWLVRRTLSLDQLGMGALLVLVALGLSVRDLVREVRPGAVDYAPRGLLLLGLGLVTLWGAAHVRAVALPLVLLSFCLSFAALVALLFGVRQIRTFYPLFGVFALFGLLAGFFPALDWPLRTVAARWSGRLLAELGLPVHLAVSPGRPPELLLAVRQRVFSVATECSGFGLLSSSLLLGLLLVLRYRMRPLSACGLLAVASLSALVINSARIVAIALAATHSSLPYGLLHEGIGTLLYLLGLWTVWKLAGRAAPVRR